MKKGTPRHPKTKRLARKLGIELPHAVGILEMLWHYTGDFAPQGDIGRDTNEDISEGVGWNQDPAILIQALTEERWLDKNARYRLIVHDWPDHAEEYVKKKLARAGLWFLSVYKRLPTKPDTVATTSRHSRDNVATPSRLARARLGLARLGKAEVDSATEEKTITREGERWTDEQAAAFLKKLKWKPSDVDQVQVDQILSIEPRLLLDLSEKPGSLATIQQQLIQFEEFFWPQYWRKTDKKAAREVWLKVTAESFDAMADALEGESRQRPEMLAKDEQYRPHAATWLRHRRWTDEAASHAD